MSRYAVVGFGNAGYHGAQAIREQDPAAVIDVYSDTALPPANPMLTTYYVKGALDYENIFPHGGLEELVLALDLTFHPRRAVTGLDAARRVLRLEDGEERQYDGILLVTGASAFLPPVSGIDLPGVFAMRTPADAKALRERLDAGGVRSALVVGASMVGIKVAEIMQVRGIDCTLADGAPYIFPLAAFESTAARIESFLEDQGIRLAFSSVLSGIEQEGEGLKVTMQDGSAYSADIVAVCIGTRANIGFLRDSGIELNRGILVDREMQTSIPGIYAAGDCAEGYELQSGERRQIGLWANAAYQGRTAGSNMAGGEEAFDFTILCNITHFMGMDFIGMGAVGEEPGDRIYEYEAENLYLRAVRDADGKLKCINMVGPGPVSGIVKNRFMKAISGSGDGDDDLAVCALLDAGIPMEFVQLLQGETST